MCTNPSSDTPKEPIDRLSATRRPRRWAVMRQNWRDLLFLHWAVSPQLLRPLVPPQLELDLFEGTAYIGLVPFTMTGVRPVGVPPIWGLSSFHETNLRTYVHLGNRDPGVWFFNLEAANSIAVRLARALFHLPYHHARMFLEHERSEGKESAGPATIVYAGVRLWPGPLPASYTIRATPARPPDSPNPAHSNTFSSNDTSSTQSKTISSSRDGSITHRIPFNQPCFSRWMKLCFQPGLSLPLVLRR